MNNKQLYTKDKTIRITFRCDGKLSEWVTSRAAQVGMTPSAFLRQICYQNFYAETVIDDMAKSNKDVSTERAADYGTNK